MVDDSNTTQYVDNYYSIDLTGSGTFNPTNDINNPQIVTKLTWTPHFEEFELPNNWLSNNTHWNALADLQVGELLLTISTNDDYKTITSLIDTTNNEYRSILEYFITKYKSLYKAKWGKSFCIKLRNISSKRRNNLYNGCRYFCK